MRIFPGKVAEIQVDSLGRLTAWIACPPGAIPAAGRYLQAQAAEISGEVLPTSLFALETSAQGFRAAPPIPAGWMPGTSLVLRGPLGNGFRLDWNIRHLALAALEDTARLMNLIPKALEQGVDVTLFTDAPSPVILPASVEVAPLSALPEALSWADLLAVDVPLPKLPRLRDVLGLRPEQHLPCPAQALIYTLMPCAGAAECGVCAVPTKRGWKLACQDGPVFDLSTLAW